MKTVEFLVVIDVTDNVTEAEVRSAAQRCLTDALHLYADAEAPRPHHFTAAPDPSFGYRKV